MTVSFTDLATEAWDRTDGVRWLAVLPVVHALLQFTRVRNVLADPTDVRVGVAFPLPAPVADVWGFTSRATSSAATATPEPPLLFALPLVLVAEALLAAAFLGGLDAAFDREPPDVVRAVRAYGLPLLGYTLLVAAGSLGLIGLVFGGTVGGAFGVGAATVIGFVVVLPVLLGLAYLFYATPFLIVVEERSLLDALGRSYDMATSGGDHAGFFVRHLLVGAVVSIPVSLLVHNVPVVGILAGAAVGGPLALAFTGATLLFVRRAVGGDESRGGPRADDSGSGGDAELQNAATG